MTWRFIHGLNSGHRIFSNPPTTPPPWAKYAIADHSGTTPDHTDDDVLWLNPCRRLRITATAIAVPVNEGAVVLVKTSDMPALLECHPGWQAEVAYDALALWDALHALGTAHWIAINDTAPSRKGHG